MAVPTTITDLSTTAASNSPAGSESIGTSLDDYIRSVQAIIKQGVSKGSDITAASTITPVATSSYFVVTGNTGITAIGETYSWVGRTVVLKFSGTPILTHSAGLILPGAANITAAAGDVAAFVNESAGVWRCSHYSNGLALTSAAIGTTVQAYAASASQGEMEAGTEAALRAMSPLRVAQAIAALGGGGGGAQIQPISASVAGNALTITAPSLTLDFRSATLTSGTVTTVTGDPADLVISSGSTLGTTSAVPSRVIVLALNNAGTIELAAINLGGSNTLDESGVISTTAEGGAGAADSMGVAYSTTARSNIAYRVIGFVESTQATAGTWATTPSTIQGAGGNAVPAREPHIYIRDEKASGTAGGTFTSGAWQTRTLNTEVIDTGNNATLASDQVTLLAGTYRFRASAPAYVTNSHKVKLKNITDSIEYIGTTTIAAAAGNVMNTSLVEGRFTIAASKVFEVQHYCQTTKATDGFGNACSFSVVEVYAEVEFWKEA